MLRHHVIRLGGTVVLTAALVPVLAGCATDADPAPMPTPSATETPSPTPSATPTEEPAAETGSLQIGPTEIAVLDVDGETLDRITYDLPAAEVVSRLTAALGSEPAEERFDAEGTDLPPATDYVWAGIRVMDFDAAGAAGERDYAVRVDGPAVGDIAIGTTDGLNVGDRIGDAVERHPDFLQYSQGSIGIFEQPSGAYVALIFDEGRTFDGSKPIVHILAPATAPVEGQP